MTGLPIAEGKRGAVFRTALGGLYDLDCVKFLRLINDASVDTFFADPPFNLAKDYGVYKDDLSDGDYVRWCKKWLREATRIVKPGGALFLYNVPKWNILLGAFLMESGLTFRHAIAVEFKSSLPIQGRLYPAHYSLLYFTKGKPARFQKIRTPIETCRHCGGEIKDYGGHRHAMNPLGVNLKDVWTDIPPVRHRKFKDAERSANALSTKILERVIEMSTYPGDLVVDPFGGSGTTYSVCEQKGRRWLGTDIGPLGPTIARLLAGDVKAHRNSDFVELSPANPVFDGVQVAAE